MLRRPGQYAAPRLQGPPGASFDVAIMRRGTIARATAYRLRDKGLSLILQGLPRLGATAAERLTKDRRQHVEGLRRG
ncbi:hypothetical protein [Gemmobacter lutimaris]|uniref:hypothetical protein n=1 Tax=Gemmobacter lutimaris TaxID=2306023 RepID=UPI0011C4444C|nr:hypothetical protein [Gemmobacter lutimaris]